MPSSGQHSCYYGCPGGELLLRVVAWGKAADMLQAVIWGHLAYKPAVPQKSCHSLLWLLQWYEMKVWWVNANKGIGGLIKLPTAMTNLRQGSPAVFATQALLPASGCVKCQGKDSLPAAAITVAETIIFRGFLWSECKVILGNWASVSPL